MALIPPSARELLESAALAHLVTLNSDGSPQVTCIWVGLDGDEVVAGHMGRWQKVRNMQADPRVTVSIETDRMSPDGSGLVEYLVMPGRARITEGGAAELLQRLAHLYLGPDVAYPPEGFRDRPGFITHITPERFGGVGPWTRGE